MKPDLYYFIENIKENIMGMNGGNETMEWYSPNKEFKFVINRFENTLQCTENDGHFIITVDIFNNIGILITQLKFSEIDAIRILYAINEFQYEMECQTGSSMYIYINADNLRLDNKIIYLERLNITPIDDYESIPGYKFRDISFKIVSSSTLYISDISLSLSLASLSVTLIFSTLIISFNR